MRMVWLRAKGSQVWPLSGIKAGLLKTYQGLGPAHLRNSDSLVLGHGLDLEIFSKAPQGFGSAAQGRIIYLDDL